MVRSGVRVLASVVVLGVVVAAGVVGWRALQGVDNPLTPNDQCTARVAGHEAVLDPEQARWAGLIVATAVSRGMPARAASIALATAYQESKLYNLHGGDRDSVGLFQQRPSQGWGRRDQLLDPVYATNAFYDALARIPGYESMAITDAAQAVQRSGFPRAYAVHEGDARALASALTGHSEHSFSCRLAEAGRRDSTSAVRDDLAAVFPAQSARPGGTSVAVPVGDRVRGWAVAQYLVSQAHRLRLAWVSYAGRTWTSGDRSGDGWSPDASTSGPAAVEVGVAGR